MRRRDFSSLRNKRGADDEMIPPLRHQRPLRHKIKTRFHNRRRATHQTAMKIVGPSGLGKASTVNLVLRDVATLPLFLCRFELLYRLEKSTNRILAIRPAVEFLIDPLSRVVLGWKVISERRQPSQ